MKRQSVNILGFCHLLGAQYVKYTQTGIRTLSISLQTNTRSAHTNIANEVIIQKKVQ